MTPELTELTATSLKHIEQDCKGLEADIAELTKRAQLVQRIGKPRISPYEDMTTYIESEPTQALITAGEALQERLLDIGGRTVMLHKLVLRGDSGNIEFMQSVIKRADNLLNEQQKLRDAIKAALCLLPKCDERLYTFGSVTDISIAFAHVAALGDIEERKRIAELTLSSLDPEVTHPEPLRQKIASLQRGLDKHTLFVKTVRGTKH